MPLFLLNNWRICFGIALFAIYSAFIYRIGGNSPRSELKALHIASENYQKESARIAKEKDNEYQMQMANTQYAWDQYRLQHPVTKPSRIASIVCADPAGNDKLSESLSAYLAEVGRFRSDVETILADADKQRDQLGCAIGFAQTINR